MEAGTGEEEVEVVVVVDRTGQTSGDWGEAEEEA